MLAASDVGLVTLDPRLSVGSVPSKTFTIMAAGRPVLAAVGSRNEIARVLAESGCGVVVPPDSPEAIAAVLRGWADDTSPLDAMGRRGRSWAETVPRPGIGRAGVRDSPGWSVCPRLGHTRRSRSGRAKDGLLNRHDSPATAGPKLRASPQRPQRSRIGRASSRPRKADVVVVGSGVTGLAAAWVLGDRATVLERDARPGGLVRTERFGDYWFDRVLHLLYFQDPDTEHHVRSLLGDVLAPCPPVAWCETSRGTTRFPFQMNLRGLDLEARLRCIRDLAEASFGGSAPSRRELRRASALHLR